MTECIDVSQEWPRLVQGPTQLRGYNLLSRIF